MDGAEVEMVRKMQAGDEDAFTWLFDRYQPGIFRAACLITGNTEDSEDIVQDTFVKCYTGRSKLKEAKAFERWLFQIMTRTAWKHVKKKRREQPAEELWGEEVKSEGKNVLDEMVEKEERQKLYSLIRRLELKQRMVIVLYYFSNFSTKEIAGMLGCMEGTVKSRLYTARKNLRNGLEQTDKEERYERRAVG